MKKYNITKILKEKNRIKKEEENTINMLNNLLPETTEELREVIQINNTYNEDYNY